MKLIVVTITPTNVDPDPDVKPYETDRGTFYLYRSKDGTQTFEKWIKPSGQVVWLTFATD